MTTVPQQRTRGYDLNDLQRVRALSFLSYSRVLQATSGAYDEDDPSPAHQANLAELKRIVAEEPNGIIDDDTDDNRDAIAEAMYEAITAQFDIIEIRIDEESGLAGQAYRLAYVG